MDNGYGESIPEWISIELQFNPQGILQNVITPKEELPEGSGIWSHLYTRVLEPTFNKFLPRKEFKNQSINKVGPNLSFLYLDVGRWGGQMDYNSPSNSGHRDFGIVCGHNALLCKFIQGEKIKSKNGSGIRLENIGVKAVNNIWTFLKALCRDNRAVEIVKWETTCFQSNKIDEDTVCVFLGDLHLPVVKEGEVDYEDINFGMPILTIEDYQNPTGMYRLVKDEPYMGRIKDFDPYIMEFKYKDKSNPIWRRFELTKWYNKYFQGDIFKGGEEDLLIFLKGIEDTINQNQLKIHFFQLGDLYELWMGLDKFYEDVEGMPGKVKLRKDSFKFVEYWIKKAKECNKEIDQILERLKEKQSTFLYGNHDCYLAMTNKRPYREKGLYCEHGHWADYFNYDGNYGNLSGHENTNRAFLNTSLRKSDPQRRYVYAAAAAIEFYSDRDFGIFVIGHTHLPYLTQVIIKPSMVEASARPMDKR